MSNILVPAFAGLRSVLESTSGVPDDIIDDINGERETIPDLTPLDDATPSDSDLLMKTSVTGPSKGVTEKTDAEYRRYH